MKIGFSKVWGGVLLGLGLVALLLALVAGFLVGPMISGGVAIIAGLAMLNRTYFEVGGGVVIVHAMIGPVTRRYPYASPKELRFEGNKLFVGSKRVGIAKSQADAEDWRKLVAYVASEAAAA